MTYDELEVIAILLYGSHWKQQIIAEFNGKPSMINNWKRQGVPKSVRAALWVLAIRRKAEIEKAVRVLG